MRSFGSPNLAPAHALCFLLKFGFDRASVCLLLSHLSHFQLSQCIAGQSISKSALNTLWQERGTLFPSVANMMRKVCMSALSVSLYCDSHSHTDAFSFLQSHADAVMIPSTCLAFWTHIRIVEWVLTLGNIDLFPSDIGSCSDLRFYHAWLTNEILLCRKNMINCDDNLYALCAGMSDNDVKSYVWYVCESAAFKKIEVCCVIICSFASTFMQACTMFCM